MASVIRKARLQPKRVVGVSGGALSAVAWIAGRERRLLERMSGAFAQEDSNVTWHDIDGDDGLTPHQRVYRKVVEDVIDSEAETAVAEGPKLQILLGRPPDGALSELRSVISGLAYEMEKTLVSRPHLDWPEATGLDGELIDACAAAREGRLAELVQAAATIPPVFRIPEWDGRPATDGGMFDQAPMPEPDEGRTLILLTRSYRNMPDTNDRRTYVQPSEPVHDFKIDFTDPYRLHDAWTLGEEDGRAFLEAFETSTQEED